MRHAPSAPPEIFVGLDAGTAMDYAGDSVAAWLRRGSTVLAGQSESPRLDAEILLGKVLGLSRSGLVAHGAQAVPPSSGYAFEAFLAQRARGVPVAYLTGTREFWSLALGVTPDVLVPRPETELLVEHALALLPHDAPRRVLDLGTGSGAVAIAIATERPRALVTAVDISPPALSVAMANGRRLGVSIDWRLGSWFDAVAGTRFDVIVANPPYVAAADPALQRLTAEPLVALTPGVTGLEALATIAAEAASYLNPRGWLLIEHGNSQADALARLLVRGGFECVRSHTDFSGHSRMTSAFIS